MAARNRPGLSENTRQRIKTTMIVERLAKHIVGELELSSTQIRAAEILLNKTLPNLSAAQVDSTVKLETSLAGLISGLHEASAATDSDLAGQSEDLRH